MGLPESNRVHACAFSTEMNQVASSAAEMAGAGNTTTDALENGAPHWESAWIDFGGEG
jgi:hypothetical protein